MIKTSEIQYNIICMSWLLDGGLVLIQMVKYKSLCFPTFNCRNCAKNTVWVVIFMGFKFSWISSGLCIHKNFILHWYSVHLVIGLPLLVTGTWTKNYVSSTLLAPWERMRKNKEAAAEINFGTWPIISPSSLITAIANRSNLLPASLTQSNVSPWLTSQISL